MVNIYELHSCKIVEVGQGLGATLVQICNTNVDLYIYTYMGGLAFMVISPIHQEFSPLFMSTLLIIQPHLKSFNDFI